MKFIKGVLYKVGSGEMVPLPLHHMAVFGVTDFSGKTTMIEAALTASGMRGLMFRTKRGELGFENAKRIPIFFDDHGLVTWQNLIGLMNAMFSDKIEREPGMKFAIQQICKRPTQAQTLQEIMDRTVAKMLEYKVDTFKYEVFGKLVNYLEEVLPQLEKVKYTDALAIGGPGLYMMDLVGLSDTVKNLILASTFKKIYESMDNVISVLPEVAKYIPAKQNTPVKWVFNRLLSEGRSVFDYVWLDTQNLKGVDKEPLRNVEVRLFGRQPDAYEIKELLRAIPLGDGSPSYKEIMTLKQGEFIAKLKDDFIKVYARPVWLPEAMAVDVAQGKLRADSDEVQHCKPISMTEEHTPQAILNTENEPEEDLTDLELRVSALETRLL